MTAKTEKPRCHHCRHYFITWEPGHPHGCRQWGFKSLRLPSVEVLQTSGKACLLCEPKLPKKL